MCPGIAATTNPASRHTGLLYLANGQKALAIEELEKVAATGTHLTLE